MTVSTSHYVAVNLGSGPNTGTGDDLLTAFNKINQNFGNYEAVGFPTKDINATGTVQAAYFIGDGSQLTAIPLGGMYSNANVASYLPTYSGSMGNLTVTGNLTVLNPLQTVVVTGNVIIGNAYVPPTSGSSGTAGQIVWNSGNIYICVATNTWKRATLSSF
jgi:hypothetical protein